MAASSRVTKEPAMPRLKVEVAKRKSAHDLIGYYKRFNPEYRSTADIMRELREGEDD